MIFLLKKRSGIPGSSRNIHFNIHEPVAIIDGDQFTVFDHFIDYLVYHLP